MSANRSSNPICGGEKGGLRTLCFFSSTLSPTMSLAAVARVLRDALLSFATSVEIESAGAFEGAGRGEG